MTEKQFIADNEYVMQNGQVYVVCGGEHSADVVATALNELISENEQLQQQLDNVDDCLTRNDIKMLKAERKIDTFVFHSNRIIINDRRVHCG